jgi:hypothetical protein
MMKEWYENVPSKNQSEAKCARAHRRVAVVVLFSFGATTAGADAGALIVNGSDGHVNAMRFASVWVRVGARTRRFKERFSA